MNALYGYARVSTDDQQTSAEAQTVRLRQYAADSGLRLAGVFVDEDVSGARQFKHRPEGRRLWDAVQAGDTVAFTKVDRAFRSMADAATTLAVWKQLGVRVAILDLGIDVATPAGELFFNQIASFAAFEREMIGQRIREAIGHRRSVGQPYGNSRPFGWVRAGSGKRTRYVPCEGERRLGERVLAMRAAGQTLSAISRALRAERALKPGKRQAERGAYYLEADVARLERAAKAGWPIAPRDKVGDQG